MAQELQNNIFLFLHLPFSYSETGLNSEQAVEITALRQNLLYVLSVYE